jgi:uncharacterized membrane protein
MDVIRIIVGVVMVLAGVLHFVYPQFYADVLPAWLPLKHELILGSGAAEILVGIALCIPSTHGIGAWALTGMMLCFLPLHALHVFSPPVKLALPYWVYPVRLALQVAFVYGSWLLR